MGRVKPVTLDLIRPRRGGGAAGTVLFALAALFTGLLVQDLLEARDDLEELRLRRAQLERRQRTREAAAAPADAAGPDQARALTDARRILSRLHTPWQRLLARSAEAAGPAIALTGLNPDAQSRTLRVTGIAPDLGEVHAFVRRLQAVAGFARVHLVQHESAPAGARAATPGVVFSVQASWSETP
jgi:Tfp pilus assembly protein PilN